jgi:hypothetical protein
MAFESCVRGKPEVASDADSDDVVPKSASRRSPLMFQDQGA